jgi:hypothetical protein
MRHVHVVINTHNRLHLIKETLPRIIKSIKSDKHIKVTHTVYDDSSDDETTTYLLGLKRSGLIDNLILGSGNIDAYKSVAQKNNPFVANYLQVLRGCMYVVPADWVLHFTDDALIEFSGLSSEWILLWIELMEKDQKIVSIQMTDHERNILSEYLPPQEIQIPVDVRLYKVNFVSDRYNFYRIRDLVEVFDFVISDGKYPLGFEVILTKKYKVSSPLDGHYCVVCQWDNRYVATHVGATNEGIKFTPETVEYLAKKLKSKQSSLTLSERTEFR